MALATWLARLLLLLARPLWTPATRLHDAATTGCAARCDCRLWQPGRPHLMREDIGAFTLLGVAVSSDLSRRCNSAVNTSVAPAFRIKEKQLDSNHAQVKIDCTSRSSNSQTRTSPQAKLPSLKRATSAPLHVHQEPVILHAWPHTLHAQPVATWPLRPRLWPDTGYSSNSRSDLPQQASVDECHHS